MDPRAKELICLRDPITDAPIALETMHISQERGPPGLCKVAFQTKHVQRAMRLCALGSFEVTSRVSAEAYYGLPMEALHKLSLESRISEAETRRRLLEELGQKVM